MLKLTPRLFFVFTLALFMSQTQAANQSLADVLMDEDAGCMQGSAAEFGRYLRHCGTGFLDAKWR